jgi:uncharacterized protein
MSTRTEPWADGTPCWADLSTPDQAAASAFYTAVLGWTVADTGDDLGNYGICMVGDRAAAGIMQQDPADPAPPAWTTYLASSDVDKTCEAIASNGGTVVMPAMDVGQEGRMAVAQDPNGAFFGVWQAGRMVGAGIVNEPGGMGWNECLSRDPAKARAFYSAVFGYEYTPMEGMSDYQTINGAGPGGTIGGVGALDPGTPEGTPAHWVAYFGVGDADAAVEAARSGGGRVLTEPFDTPHGRMATIADPYGAVLSLAQVPDWPVSD